MTTPRRSATLRDLVARIIEGDHQAFARFYDLTARDVLGITTSVLRNRFQAQEVTQEVYLEVWRQARRLDPERRADHLLRQLARRRAIDRLRSVQADRERDHAHAGRHQALHGDDVAVDAETRLSYVPVADAILELPRIHQDALFLAYTRGLGHTQIAAELQIPLGTVKTRLRDSVRHLRTQILGSDTLP